jgi:hypothetical protein
MAIKRVLYFTAESRAIYRWSAGGLDLEATFPADETGIEPFREFLSRARGTHLYVVADLAGEDFHEDQIPYLRGSDRDTIIQRRLAQRYREARLAAAFSLGISEGERRNERLLLASFANPEQFAPWLDEVARAGITLAGVFSTPLLAPGLASLLGARGGHALVVTLDAAGLRQSFVEDGKLRFARLERTADMAPEALAAFVRSETSRLVQYLATLRVLPKDGAPVQVFAIAAAGQRAAFENALVSDQRLAFHTIDLDEAARKIGLKRLSRQAQAEQLYLHLAVKRPPKEQFARKEDRRAFFLWNLQRGLAAAGALGFVVCAGLGAAKWLDVMAVGDAGAVQAREAAQALSEYQRITSAFPVTQTTTDNLRAAVTEFRSIASRSSWPAQDFLHVSLVLDKFGQLELDKLDWRIDREGALGGKPVAGAPVVPPAAGAAGATPAGTDASAAWVRVIEVAGTVNATQRTDYRGITAQVQKFADALRGNGAYQVVRTQLPFDTTSDSVLSGDIGEGESGEAPRFTIVIARRLQ